MESLLFFVFVFMLIITYPIYDIHFTPPTDIQGFMLFFTTGS